jgi:hypothetical protein
MSANTAALAQIPVQPSAPAPEASPEVKAFHDAAIDAFNSVVTHAFT